MLTTRNPAPEAVRLPRAPEPGWHSATAFEIDPPPRPNSFAIPAGFSSRSSALPIIAALALVTGAMAAAAGHLAPALFGSKGHAIETAAIAQARAMLAAPPPSPESGEATAFAPAPVAQPPEVVEPPKVAGIDAMATPAAPPVTPSPALPAPAGADAHRSAEDTYAGLWVPHQRACSPRPNQKGYLPALIQHDGAWAGETSCAFSNIRRMGRSWTVSATCADTRSNWKTNVTLTVNRDRLIWKSSRGTQVYMRCSAEAQQAGRIQSRV
jgi:hypothetical protein